MKKLMIALVAVAFGVCTQAATVNWNSGTIYAPGEGGNGYAPNDVWVGPATGEYLTQIFVSTTADMGSLVTFTSGDTSNYVDGDGYATGIASSLEAGDYYGKMIVTEVATGATLTSEIFKFNVSSVSGKGEPMVGDGGAFITKVDGSAFTDEIYGAWSTTGWVASAVPEPTSGLLLLLGVAGLALRRRRA